MEVTSLNLQKKITINTDQVRKLVKRLLNHLNKTKGSLSIVFVSRQKMQALNKKFLGRSYSTDVIAFEDPGPEPALRNQAASNKLHIYGDIVICPEVAVRQASLYQTELADELGLYIIHGLLHLMDYDDHKKEDIKRMRRKEQELMRFIAPQWKNLLKKSGIPKK